MDKSLLSKIEGYARKGLTPFEMPLLTHVEGNLWHGACPMGTLPEEFLHVYDFYNGEQYEIGANTVRKVQELLDNSEIPPEDLLISIARSINKACKEGLTLVHCQAGLNRSGLLIALALILRGREPEDAIKLLRERRSPIVLCNQHFERWLLTQGRKWKGKQDA